MLIKTNNMNIKVNEEGLKGYIKGYRAALGITQVELADLVGVSVPAVKSWEQGGRNPSKSALSLMRDHLKNEVIKEYDAALSAAYKAINEKGVNMPSYDKCITHLNRAIKYSGADALHVGKGFADMRDKKAVNLFLLNTVFGDLKNHIMETFDLPPNFLISYDETFIKKSGSGEGEMLTTGTSVTPAVELNTVPLLPVSAQAGSLNDFLVTVNGNGYERIVSPVKGADFALTVSGDSMFPEYPAGSYVFVKKVDEKVFIEWGGVYVLDTLNGSVIKKLMPVADDPDRVRCESINPAYPAFDIKLSDVFGVYKVLLCMSMK